MFSFLSTTPYTMLKLCTIWIWFWAENGNIVTIQTQQEKAIRAKQGGDLEEDAAHAPHVHLVRVVPQGITHLSDQHTPHDKRTKNQTQKLSMWFDDTIASKNRIESTAIRLGHHRIDGLSRNFHGLRNAGSGVTIPTETYGYNRGNPRFARFSSILRFDSLEQNRKEEWPCGIWSWYSVVVGCTYWYIMLPWPRRNSRNVGILCIIFGTLFRGRGARKYYFGFRGVEYMLNFIDSSVKMCELFFLCLKWFVWKSIVMFFG